MTHRTNDTVRLSWYEVWLRALWPSIEGYQIILAHNKDITLKKAALWIYVTAAIGTSTLGLIAIRPAQVPLLYRHPILLVITLLIVIPISQLLVWSLLAGGGHLLARLLGGARQFRELAYVFAAFFAPLTVIDSVVSTINIYFGFSKSLIPSIPIVWLLFEVYRIVLGMVAAKSLYSFSWAKAFICILPMVVSGLLYLLIWV